ncbi:MAG: hypothetical protein KatS3mg103_1140 [Phycisphaerales bacterium]|nr:MAG: hypothetical protein KatS3mg103_1140 [Phycisphaerales bacterium]
MWLDDEQALTLLPGVPLFVEENPAFYHASDPMLTFKGFDQLDRRHVGQRSMMAFLEGHAQATEPPIDEAPHGLEVSDLTRRPLLPVGPRRAVAGDDPQPPLPLRLGERPAVRARLGACGAMPARRPAGPPASGAVVPGPQHPDGLFDLVADVVQQVDGRAVAGAVGLVR